VCIGRALLVATGVALAIATSQVRNFDALLPSPGDGAPPALGHEVGDDAGFTPFAFAVIGAPRGDAAALERALDQIAANRDVQLSIVIGDVLPRDDEDVLPLADVLARHWRGTVLLAGKDDIGRDVVDARLAARTSPPTGWAFVEHGCLFRGATTPGDAVDARLGDPVIIFDFTPSHGLAQNSVTRFAAPEAGSDRLAYEIVEVRSPTRIERSTCSVPRGASIASVSRASALRLLWPLTSSDAGRLLVLAIAFMLVMLGAMGLGAERHVIDATECRQQSPGVT
jgi:hypothetical protein